MIDINNISKIKIRFYEELNDLLPENKRKITFELNPQIGQSVKDLIEAQGVPHTEVDLILVNGESVGFEYIVNHGDRISVYPNFEALDISEVTKLREKPLRDTKFIVDVNLGKLAKYLRLLGFDTIYRNDLEDVEIVEIANEKQRIIITRDLGILKRNEVRRGYFVRSQDPIKQAKEVVRKFDLVNSVQPFSLCLDCNGKLEEVSKDEIADRLLPGTKKNFKIFHICANCRKIYWEGSHHERMRRIVEEILSS